MAIFMRKRQLEVKQQMKAIQARNLPSAYWAEQWQQSHGSLLKMAMAEQNLPPCLMARLVLKALHPQDPKLVTQQLQDPSLIGDSVLREAVIECVAADGLYGPTQDKQRHAAGQRGEEALYATLEQLGIPFWREREMRLQGYAKTPDAILLEPIAIGGCIVRWIESKAWFGDPTGHQECLREQFFPYVNRFGPGMVIYWSGLVEELDVWHERGILLADRLETTRLIRIKL